MNAPWSGPSKPGKMPCMNRGSARRIALWAALGLAAAALSPAAAEARGKRKNQTYIFSLYKVEMVEGVPGEVEEQVKKRLAKQIEDRDALEPEIDKKAPDPKKTPKKFERYLKRRNRRAFKVNVEVTDYSMDLEPIEGSSSKHLAVHLSLRMFGETIPDRVMAFTGDGSATVKVEVGRRVRDRDREYANDEALKLAVSDAVDQSIKMLRMPAKKRKRLQKRRRRQRERGKK